jgi:hypothetical protein
MTNQSHGDRRKQQDLAKQRLAPLIRCPHLSRYWLSGTVNSLDADAMLLAELRPQIRQLLLLRDAKADYMVTDTSLLEGNPLAGAPPSWVLEQRVVKPVGSVELVWQLEVCKLRDTARLAAAGKHAIEVHSTRASPPLGGIDFVLSTICHGYTGDTRIGMYCTPHNLWTDMTCVYDLEIEVVGFHKFKTSCRQPDRDGYGGGNIFDVGSMAGGWDEVAWAGKGLPTSGQLTIKLTVSKVSHALGT